MSHAQTAQPALAAAKDEQYVVTTPVWLTVVRGAQIFFAFVIIILAGLLIHGLAMDANVFALVCCLFTFIIATYALVSEKVASAKGAYNIWAILSLDLFMAILWLASMGANAALRATFKVSVNASCYSDGSTVNSGRCEIYKRESLHKRAAVATAAGLAWMSAIAGLSALEMFLFIAPLVFNGHAFRMHHQNKTNSVSATTTNVEMGHQQTPMLDPNHPSVATQYPQYNETQEYKPQVYPQPQHTPQPTPSPQPYGYNQQPYQPPQQQQPFQHPQQQQPYHQSPQQQQPYQSPQPEHQHYQVAQPQQQSPPTQPYNYPQNQPELPGHH